MNETSSVTLRQHTIELHLRHTFRLSRGASDARRNVILELEHEGLIGLGEAAPIARYGQSAESSARALATMSERLGEPMEFDEAARRAAVPGEEAAEAALDIALWDLAGKRLGEPIYRLLGLDPEHAPPTSFTIGLDSPEIVTEKVREATGFAALKVKLGTDDDLAVLAAVRSATDQPLRVDANEGWTLDGALTRLETLAALGVELVEQPLPAGELEAMRELKRQSPLPLFADESVHRAADIPRLVGAFDGINIKLMKCGGIGEALRMIRVARALGMRIMLGCMIETSIGITAAAHLLPLVDYADLDGHLLITNDPFVGARLEEGRLVPTSAPGLGVEERR